MSRPLIGICASFNNILRAIGTDVVEDKTKSHDKYDINYRHEVAIIKGTKLYDLLKREKYDVNSIHSMIAPKEKVERKALKSNQKYSKNLTILTNRYIIQKNIVTTTTNNY